MFCNDIHAPARTSGRLAREIWHGWDENVYPRKCATRCRTSGLAMRVIYITISEAVIKEPYHNCDTRMLSSLSSILFALDNF